jgi:capsular exopolysaccharide synthesis family protein
VGGVAVAEGADRRIRRPEDLEELTGLPLLTVVPREAFSQSDAAIQRQEAFHMLLSALTYFNVDRPLSTVLVSSASKGDGKSTVASGLAIAAAQAGRDVILLDADLRLPQAARRLGVGNKVISTAHGLAGVLTSQTSLEEALIEVAVDTPSAMPDVDASSLSTGRLRLLPAGTVTPPNPSELLASRRMRDVLGEVAELADLVIVDTNPPLEISDSLPLLDAVSGVVVVAKLNSTTRDAITRLQKTIAQTGGNALGAVATGATGRLFGSYGYDYYGAPDGNDTVGLSTRLMRLGRSLQVKQPT